MSDVSKREKRKKRVGLHRLEDICSCFHEDKHVHIIRAWENYVKV